jgi:hypothetical protein
MTAGTSEEERQKQIWEAYGDLTRTEWTHVREAGRYLVTHVDEFHAGPKTWVLCVRYIRWEGGNGYVRTLDDFRSNMQRL